MNTKCTENKEHILVSDVLSQSKNGTTVSIKAGATLFTQAKVNDAFFRLIKGAVSVQINIEGQLFTVATYSLAQLNQTTWFGELPTTKTSVYSYQLSCIEDTEFERFDWRALDNKDQQAEHLLGCFSHPLLRVRQARALYQCMQNVSSVISTQFLEAMLQHCQFVNVDPNHVIFKQGDAGTSAYFLLNGKLSAYVGNNETKVGEISRGELFGEMAVISGEERSATIIASRHSELAQLSTDSFRALSEQFPQLNQAVINILMARLKTQNERLDRQNKPKNKVIVSLSRHQQEDLCPLQEVDQALNKQGVETVSSQTMLKDIDEKLSYDDIAPHRVTAYLEAKETNNRLNLFTSYFDEIEWSHHCLQKADEIWLLVNSAEPTEDITSRLSPFLCQPYWRNLTINLILTHKNTAFKETDKWISCIDADNCFHMIVRNPNSVARIARQLSEKANSLVLGGGGAKGFAHIGVIRALEEANIPIDSVGGTSIGAVMGGWVAMGFDAQQMTEAVQQYFVSINPLGDYTLPIISLSKSSRLDTLLHRSYKERNIEDLPLPFFCISSDLSTAQEKCHENGKLWRAVRASLAIPGIITPAIENGHFLVDGGLLNNLPCDLMNQRSNGPVLAIDVTDINNFDTQLSSMPNPWSTAWKKWISRQKVTVPTIIETLFRSSMLASYNKRNDNIRKVDYYIQPDVKDYGILDFTQATQIIEKGYVMGLSIIEDLEKTLANAKNN